MLRIYSRQTRPERSVFEYPVFEAAITGRANLDDSATEEESKAAFKRGTSMIALSRQSDQELEAIRNAVVQREGLLLDVFDVLRRVPRRVLMVLKLNDLTRCAYSYVWNFAS